MTAKQMKFDTAAHEEFLAGIEKMTKAVGLTLGPAGRNVVVQKSYGGPSVTKDGVSVAKEIDLPDQFENMGAKMLHQNAVPHQSRLNHGAQCANSPAVGVFADTAPA